MDLYVSVCFVIHCSPYIVFDVQITQNLFIGMAEYQADPGDPSTVSFSC